MTLLERMRQAGFQVNWRTLLVGWDGPGKHPPLVTPDEVRAFAEERLNTPGEPDPDVVAIAVSVPEGRADVDRYVRKLAERDPANPATELRKWQVVLLSRAMEELPKDALYALLALTDFWERFGFPTDSPHVVQGRGNRLSPTDYYTDDNYTKALAKHKAWLLAETTDLRRELPGDIQKSKGLTHQA